MISLITWQHLNVYSYKLKNNVCVISMFHLYEAKKTNTKKLAGKKLLWQVVKKVNFRPWLWVIREDSPWMNIIYWHLIQVLLGIGVVQFDRADATAEQQL